MTEIPLTTAPPKPNPAVLEERWLHNVMVRVQSFHDRPLWWNALTLIVMFRLILAFWELFAPPIATAATVIFVVAVGGDLLLLWLLPQRKISFGPIEPQLLVMMVPRLLVTALALALSTWNQPLALGVFFVLQAAGSAAYVWGMAVEPQRMELTKLDVVSPKLPADAPPIRLLHISDLHVERLTQREERVLELIAEAHPDVIVITGDFLNLSYNNDPESMAQVRSLLAKIHAPHGVFAVLGSPPVDLPEIAAAHFDDTEITLLRHDAHTLDLGDGRRLTLLGMDCTHDMAYDEHRFEELTAQLQNGDGARVLLYHSPEMMPFVQKFDVDLYLCGHTHGGQVRVPGYGAIITSAITGKRYEMGRYDENGTTLYVSRGIGLEGLSAPRLRLFCPPEMTLVTLRGENAPA